MCHKFTEGVSSVRLLPFQWSVFACSPKESIIALPHNIFLNSSSISNIMSRLWLEILLLSIAWDTFISGRLFRKIDANINPAKWNLLQKHNAHQKIFLEVSSNRIWQICSPSAIGRVPFGCWKVEKYAVGKCRRNQTVKFITLFCLILQLMA